MNISRDEWVISNLKSLSGSILDVGAGEQPFRKHCSHLQYFSHDFCEYDGKGDGTGLQFEWSYGQIDYVSDITSIDADDNTFDSVLCTDVLEHVPDPVAAVREMSRILKPEGVLLLTVPYASLSHMAPQHYYPGLTKYWYKHHLRALSHDILDISINGNYYDYVAQECALSMRPEYSSYTLTERDKVTINRMEQLMHRMGSSLLNEESPLSLGLYVKSIKRSYVRI